MTTAAAQPLSIDVVSVQSQVVYGRVGNNVAMPTLQRCGLSAAAVPTVVLSNTPHYPSVHGGAIPLDWFAGYLDDLTARGGLRRLRGIVSGYLGSPEQAAVLARWIARTLETSRELRVLVDPVIGDHDSGIYVDPALIAAYREHLLPLADGLTPNGFELELLSGRPSTDADSVVAAARSLLRGRTRWVIVTSANPAAWEEGRMQIAVVTRDEAQWLTHPRLDIAPKGTGDVFSAAMLGGLLHGASVFEAAAAASEAVVAALRLTQRAGCAELLLPESPLFASGHSA